MSQGGQLSPDAYLSLSLDDLRKLYTRRVLFGAELPNVPVPTEKTIIEALSQQDRALFLDNPNYTPLSNIELVTTYHAEILKRRRENPNQVQRFVPHARSPHPGGGVFQPHFQLENAFQDWWEAIGDSQRTASTWGAVLSALTRQPRPGLREFVDDLNHRIKNNLPLPTSDGPASHVHGANPPPPGCNPGFEDRGQEIDNFMARWPRTLNTNQALHNINRLTSFWKRETGTFMTVLQFLSSFRDAMVNRLEFDRKVREQGVATSDTRPYQPNSFDLLGVDISLDWMLFFAYSDWYLNAETGAQTFIVAMKDPRLSPTPTIEQAQDGLPPQLRAGPVAVYGVDSIPLVYRAIDNPEADAAIIKGFDGPLYYTQFNTLTKPNRERAHDEGHFAWWGNWTYDGPIPGLQESVNESRRRIHCARDSMRIERRMLPKAYSSNYNTQQEFENAGRKLDRETIKRIEVHDMKMNVPQPGSDADYLAAFQRIAQEKANQNAGFRFFADQYRQAEDKRLHQAAGKLQSEDIMDHLYQPPVDYYNLYEEEDTLGADHREAQLQELLAENLDENRLVEPRRCIKCIKDKQTCSYKRERFPCERCRMKNVADECMLSPLTRTPKAKVYNGPYLVSFWARNLERLPEYRTVRQPADATKPAVVRRRRGVYRPRGQTAAANANANSNADANAGNDRSRSRSPSRGLMGGPDQRPYRSRSPDHRMTGNPPCSNCVAHKTHCDDPTRPCRNCTNIGEGFLCEADLHDNTFGAGTQYSEPVDQFVRCGNCVRSGRDCNRGQRPCKNCVAVGEEQWCEHPTGPTGQEAMAYDSFNGGLDFEDPTAFGDYNFEWTLQQSAEMAAPTAPAGPNYASKFAAAGSNSFDPPAGQTDPFAFSWNPNPTEDTNLMSNSELDNLLSSSGFDPDPRPAPEINLTMRPPTERYQQRHTAAQETTNFSRGQRPNTANQYDPPEVYRASTIQEYGYFPSDVPDLEPDIGDSNMAVDDLFGDGDILTGPPTPSFDLPLQPTWQIKNLPPGYNADEKAGPTGMCTENTRYWTTPRTGEQCGKYGAMNCDLVGDDRNCTCFFCRTGQRQAVLTAERMAIERTKLGYCESCVRDLEQLRTTAAAGVPGLRFGSCYCVGQLQGTWVCNVHRREKRVELDGRVRVMRDARQTRGLEGRCGRCAVNDSLLVPTAWACVACETHVLEQP